MLYYDIIHTERRITPYIRTRESRPSTRNLLRIEIMRIDCTRTPQSKNL